MVSRFRIAAALALGVLLLGTGTPAYAGTYGDRLVAEGHEFFRAGNYFRANESYRCAVLEEPGDGMKKLHFGNSLFALGNYAYAAYSFRRGVRVLGYPDDLKVDLIGMFPSRHSFDRSVRDVRRYASYYPNDPHALTVIAYVAYFAGDRTEADSACKKLLQIDPRDAFAAYVLRRIEMEGGALATAPAPKAEPAVAEGQKPGAPPATRPASATEGQGGIVRVPAVDIAKARAEERKPPAPPPAPAPAPKPAAAAANPPAAQPKPPAPVVAAKPPEKPAPPATWEIHSGERSEPATAMSTDELAPAIAR